MRAQKEKEFSKMRWNLIKKYMKNEDTEEPQLNLNVPLKVLIVLEK